MLSSVRPTNFATLYIIWFILNYPIDLICLAFAVNGGWCQHTGNRRILIAWQILLSLFLTVLKILFVQLEWSKILKDPLKEDFPIVSHELRHILPFLYIYLF